MQSLSGSTVVNSVPVNEDGVVATGVLQPGSLEDCEGGICDVPFDITDWRHSERCPDADSQCISSST